MNSNPELCKAAEKLLKWDKRRSKVEKLLGHKHSLTNEEKEALAKCSNGIPFGQSSYLFDAMVNRKRNRFCKAILTVPESEILPAESMIAHRVLGGNPTDPLVKFPNGLILRCVDAANYILETQTP
jgi:hypothetical protein